MLSAPDWLRAAKRRLDGWILFTAFRRPRSRREAGQRGAIVAAVVAAALIPVFIERGGGDLLEGAGEAFRAQLAELDQARLDLELVDDDSVAADDLRARIADLEAETQLGYLPRDDDEAAVNALVPDFRLLDLEGRPFRLSNVETPFVLNFWASWCQPCIEEMPDFQMLQDELGERVLMIGVNDGESRATAVEFRDRLEVDYLILLDPTKQLTDGPYGLIGRPTTYYVDADGIIRDIRVGIHTLETMRELTGGLLGEDLGDLESSQAEGPTGYTESGLDVIDSAFANLQVWEDLLDRWRVDEEIYNDPAWQRNVVGQARGWSELVIRFEALTPPQSLQMSHDDFLAALRAVEVSGRLLTDAVELPNPSLVETASTLFDEAQASVERSGGSLRASLGGG